MRAIDSFEAQALNLLTSSEAEQAFDLQQEDPRLAIGTAATRGGNNA